MKQENKYFHAIWGRVSFVGRQRHLLLTLHYKLLWCEAVHLPV